MKREPITVCCADCDEPTPITMMHHGWDKSTCLLCFTRNNQPKGDNE